MIQDAICQYNKRNRKNDYHKIQNVTTEKKSIKIYLQDPLSHIKISYEL